MTNEFYSYGKAITIFGAEHRDVPVVLFNSVMNEGEKVYSACQAIQAPPFALAVISRLDWNKDMSPWAMPPISKDDTPCQGGANEYLDFLVNTVVPEVDKRLDGKCAYHAIAGYSLAGLFAVFALYKTGIFSKVASASGSFWFPDFVNFATQNKMVQTPDCIYFSLGDREAKTSNSFLKTVEVNTKKLEAFYRGNGIDTIYVSNEGNHFKNANLRMAQGIKWILEN